MSRPEAQGPPEHYYDATESRKYAQNTRIVKIQTEMAERALELLCLPQDDAPRLILDLGCGSGLSGGVLATAGHYWVGMDISSDMLEVARERLEDAAEPDKNSPDADADMDVDEHSPDDAHDNAYNDDTDSDNAYDSDSEAPTSSPDQCVDLFHHDMGDGACFRPGTFDGCISISALQWLCHSNRSRENPKARLTRLFSTLFGSLARGARAVFQFYPETSSQIDLILGCAMRAGFTGGLVVDFPNSTRAKKYYLCLMTGPSAELPQGLEDGETASAHVGIGKRARHRHRDAKFKDQLRTVAWVKSKKELARKRGQDTKSDSKYTARKRRVRF